MSNLAEALALLAGNTPLLAAVTGVVGLVVGSFLNVVTLRLPALLEHRWRLACRELLELDPADEEPPRGIAVPPSRCPHCGHRLRAWENVPLLSYALLRGRCRSCGCAISPRYPLVEALTGALSAIVALRLAPGWELAAGLGLTWMLIALAVIDIDHQILPDDITLPGLWLGLLAALVTPLADPVAALTGAMAGYMILWSVYQLFRLLTGKEGMGYGDFKLLAMLGAWLGWQALPGIILIGAVGGAALGSLLIVLSRGGRDVPIPFGPYLALGGWIMLLWGEAINTGYLRLAGLS